MFGLKPQILSTVQKASTFGIGIDIAVAVGLSQAREADFNRDTELFSVASTVCIPMS
jgi:hypothetical protein